jgi:hypothetical protein
MNDDDSFEKKRKRLEMNKRKWKSQRRQLAGKRTNFSSQQRKRSQRRSNNLKSEAMKKFWQKKKELIHQQYEDSKSDKEDNVKVKRIRNRRRLK